MDNNENFNDLWAKQTTDLPQVEKLTEKLSSVKREKRTKLVVTNILMVATIAAMIAICLYFEPRLMTTKVGIVLILLGIISYLFAYNQLLPHLRQVDQLQSSSEFLMAVIKLKERERFLQTNMLQFYFIILTIGVCLYLYEYVSLMPFSWAVVAYSVTLTWFAFNWFYLRKRIIRQQREKLDGIIEQFEKVQGQI